MDLSFVITKSIDGEYKMHAESESSVDPAFSFFHVQKVAKGRDESGQRIYTDAELYIKGKRSRRTHFSE